MKLATDLPLHRITLPTPFPVGPVHVYLITEPELTLIDTGPLTKAARTLLDQELAAIGLRAERLKRIVLTHSHQDHYGMAAELSRRSGAPVYAHALEHPSIQHDPGIGRFYVDLMTESGTPPATVESMRALFAFLSGVSEAVPEVRPLQELPSVVCGGAEFAFVGTPGHTPGHVSLWEPKRRFMIGGDVVIERITPNPFSAVDPTARNGRFQSLAAYWKTFDAIQDLDTAEIHAGHGNPVTDFPAYYQWSLDLHRSRQDVIERALRNGARNAHDIAASLFPEVMKEGSGSFLALTEIFSHMDLLEEEGRVRREMDGAVAIYSIHA